MLEVVPALVVGIVVGAWGFRLIRSNEKQTRPDKGDTGRLHEVVESDFPEPFEPDWLALGSDDDFGHAAFGLLTEAVLLAVLLVHRIPATPYHRDEAIRRGLVKRLVLLGKSLLADIAHNSGYQQTQIVRQLIEAAANYYYLSKDDGSGERYEAYIKHSLAEEKHNLEIIAQEIKARGGDPLPIEKRMRESIAHMASAAGFGFESIPPKRKSGWPNAFDRLKALSPTAYPAYRGGSSALHSGWSVLLLEDIREVDGEFMLDARRAPAVAPMTAAGIIVSEAIAHYLDCDGDDLERATFGGRFAAISDKLRRLDTAHEQFMQR